jgi:hypothetical protein
MVFGNRKMTLSKNYNILMVFWFILYYDLGKEGKNIFKIMISMKKSSIECRYINLNVSSNYLFFFKGLQNV